MGDEAESMMDMLERLEVGTGEPDFRRLVGQERLILQNRMRAKDWPGVAKQVAECRRVLKIWKGHY